MLRRIERRHDARERIAQCGWARPRYRAPCGARGPATGPSLNEPAWRPVFAAALARRAFGAGTRLLDVGCGSGGALALARELGAEPAGLDAAANLVAIARQRLPGAPIEVGEMEELPFADESFDVVTGINSFQFAGDMVHALAEARRVLRPGGTLLMLVWGRREDCEFISGTMPAVFALLPQSRPGAPPPRPLAEPGVIEGLMRRGRPHAARKWRVRRGTTAPADADTAVRTVLTGSARAIDHAGEAAVAAAIRGTLPRFHAGRRIRGVEEPLPLGHRDALLTAERRGAGLRPRGAAGLDSWPERAGRPALGCTFWPIPAALICKTLPASL